MSYDCDYEEPELEEITDWSHCEKHGKYPTEATEIIGEGLTICPLCYKELQSSCQKVINDE